MKTSEVIVNELDSFRDALWENLYLEEYEYELCICLNDFQSVYSVAVKDSTSRHIVKAPGTYSAKFYADSHDYANEVFSNCPYVNYLYNGVDALVVYDPECEAAISERDGGPKAVRR